MFNSDPRRFLPRSRVFIDLGTRLNTPATFAPGFNRFISADRYVGKEGKQAATTRLIEADRAFNARIASEGAAKAYRRVLAPRARVHRQGVGALMDDAALAWFESAGDTMTATTDTGDAAESGDLGYTYGKYQRAGGKPATYLRVWSRTAAGVWRLVVDVFVA